MSSTQPQASLAHHTPNKSLAGHHLSHIKSPSTPQVTSVAKDLKVVNVSATPPKSAGYNVMSWLLGTDDKNNKLFLFLLRLLGECNLSQMDKDDIEAWQYSQRQIVSIVVTGAAYYKLQHNLANPNAATLPVFSDLLLSHQQMDQLNYSTMNILPSDVNYNQASHASYWKKRVISLCVGLFYECSLREEDYVRMFYAPPPMPMKRPGMY